MIKKKIITFYSDLRGTYMDDSMGKSDRNEKVDTLFKNLEEYRIATGCDEVKFSFITSDSYDDDLIGALNEVRQHISKYNNIKLGRTFSLYEYIDDGVRTLRTSELKIGDINNETKRLSEDYDVSKIIYVDDATINTHMAEMYISRFKFPYDIDVLLAQDGLDTVNSYLQSLILDESYNSNIEKPNRIR